MLVELLHADPLVLAISLVALLVFVVAPLGRWTQIGRVEQGVADRDLVAS